jgi:2',3'-cyclic-nucleotide 2'-phosphodiesterase (5'-nucleotidase family)
MSRRFSRWLILVCTGIILSCKSFMPAGQQAAVLPVQRIDPDPAILKYYEPYKDSLDQIMEVKLADLEADLSKQQPESTLGNLMADILLRQTAKYAGIPVDLGVVNYGGIRIPSLAKGPLKVLHAYNLMPFDNYLVTLRLTGTQVQALCDSIAMKKGWPVSGLRFRIGQGRAVNVQVQGQDLEPGKTYTVAMSDYLAGGGDGLAFLRDIPHTNTGVLYRDAIMEYWKEEQAAGRTIGAQLENRITYAE